MKSAREEILEGIRQSLKRTGPLEHSVAAMLAARLAGREVHVQPVVEGDLVTRFVAKLEAVSGSVTRVSSFAQVPRAVKDYLKLHSMLSQVVMANDPLLAKINWLADMKIEKRAAKREDRASVTGAFAGIAETGSLVLLSGPYSPTTLNFLPEIHIVVLRSEHIVAHIEDVWWRLRAEVDEIPRTVNFITGPSRTADIEQTIQLGAHGPRNLHVILVEA